MVRCILATARPEQRFRSGPAGALTSEGGRFSLQAKAEEPWMKLSVHVHVCRGNERRRTWEEPVTEDPLLAETVQT